ncbi:MAG: hypothetical protein HZA36_02370, partial [Parcubacteria group bacterium]|nr:hypothetical protein [Parcubacteria group bacterium]
MKRLFWIIVVLLIFGVAFYWYHNRGCSAPDNKGHVGAAYLYPDVNFT